MLSAPYPLVDGVEVESGEDMNDQPGRKRNAQVSMVNTASQSQ
jgi:hypothetical protein